jgi:hypothetical protein
LARMAGRIADRWFSIPWFYVPVRVAVDAGRGPMGGPPGVSDTAVGVESLVEVKLGLIDELLQFGHLADLLERKDLILLVTIDSETGGVVPAIFEPGQT